MSQKHPPPPSPLFDTLAESQGVPPSSVNTLPHAAQSDLKQVHAFLLSYRGNQATFNAYRRELERFLHWNWTYTKKPLSRLQRQEIEAFIAFCQNPPLTWIGTKNAPRFISQAGARKPNPDWRPFVVTVSKVERRLGKTPDPKNYFLSQQGVQALFSILSSFFNFLIEMDYAAINPVRQIRQKSQYLRKQQHKTVVRRLGELQWAYVIETTEALANADPKHERSLFIMNALYGMYLRISELCSTDRWTPTMGDFHCDADGNWWFTTVGKGNKERIITVSDAMLAALERYRLALGLTRHPTPAESTPLISKSHGKGPITSTRHIRSIVQTCFDHAIARLEADGFSQEAEQLKAATVHWLRHTGISDDVKIRPREHVRDDAGHSSSAITDRYVDVALRERHASGKKKKIKPEDVTTDSL